MEVKIGISDSPRELVISSAQTQEEVEALVSGALGGDGGVLALTDEKGRKFLIQASKVAYVEIGSTTGGRVGFAAV
ncbi:DUF3107 domain-containing protein [Nocardia beijingensis]|uniref:DUF3107 domain-containing protein n=1 Tax=Nocardia sputorum TaxID=2984338 RepID=A0ABM8CSN5_9NOCA|nr:MULTISPECIES: DUF3107 domain-containing protein [Nocardia]MBF6469538.1 DUF3107 domain-containing protein [Nocardia beijingensis]BDT96200.1 hypothetical protein IFM12275_61760 [Nocardia sputorum]BDT97960.1 hypothetical protein IFM12276_09890 [Nocardia sputorum]